MGEETLFRAALCGMLVFFCVLGDGVTGDRKTTRGEIDDGRQEKETEKEKAEFFPEKAPQKAPQKNTALG